ASVSGSPAPTSEAGLLPSFPSRRAARVRADLLEPQEPGVLRRVPDSGRLHRRRGERVAAAGVVRPAGGDQELRPGVRRPGRPAGPPARRGPARRRLRPAEEERLTAEPAPPAGSCRSGRGGFATRPDGTAYPSRRASRTRPDPRRRTNRRTHFPGRLSFGRI